MIAYLKGHLLEKAADRVVIEAGGVGYEISINASTAARLPAAGAPAELFIFESAGMYGGSVSLYGFLTGEEKQMFLTCKTLKATGAKKALEYLDKTAKSLPDFRRAIIEGDAKVLKTLFGFTAKTADKLILGLKDKLGRVQISGAERLRRDSRDSAHSSTLSQAIHALASLGYTQTECRTAIEAVQREELRPARDVAELVRLALRRL